MAQHRQQTNFSTNDHVIGIRGGPPYKHSRPVHRRFRTRKVSLGSLIVAIALLFVVSASAFLFLSRDRENYINNVPDDASENDTDFLTNVTRTESFKVLKFGHGSLLHGRDSRYWDKDDRRRDDDYSEDVVEQASVGTHGGSTVNSSMPIKRPDRRSSDHRNVNLYNEAGRNELKMYEAEYEASLKSVQSRNEVKNMSKLPDHTDVGEDDEEFDADEEYDDGISTHDSQLENLKLGQQNSDTLGRSNDINDRRVSDLHGAGTKDRNIDGKLEEAFNDLADANSSKYSHSDKVNGYSRHASDVDVQFSGSSSETRFTSRKKPKKRKFSGLCEMKLLNSTSNLVEPLQSRKFARFSLQYIDFEENPFGSEPWEPKFAGHQDLKQRELSYIARDQKINCGFVKGPKGSLSTGFDLTEDDAKYISTCHIAVVSCIFGNSDRLRSPMGKTVSRLSRKNICFVMFVDEVTLKMLSSEGQMPDSMGFVGLWKVVVVKNLPYTDMRRVGKIPKFLAHRLFPSARYSIWLDSKLRLQLDPLLILEYFLWRKGYEYAISNHYDRHCVWEEVAQNKKLNKYNHTVIDEQFAFYQADGLKRFNPMDPHKLLPSNVPEGSFIVRAHTPMSNLFSCLWFNEVERFTPRDQLSFAYTYQKLRRTNPDNRFYLNMFKDCERRKIAKLFRHRSEERRYTSGNSRE